MSRKVTDDTALTGANLATGDLFDVVDISDTTDDATGTNKKMTAAETVKGLGLLGGNRLITTAVKTTTYTAAVGDHVPCDATSASFTVTLPTAPADGAEIAVQLVATASAHNVTVALGGSDVLDVASGATSMILDSSLLFHTVRYHYNASGAIWYRISNYVRLGARGSLFTRNANGLSELAVGTSGKFLRTDGTDPSWQTIATSDVSGLTTVATDVIWDTVGDLAVATGADTAAKLAMGTTVGAALVSVSTSAAAPQWQYPHGVEAASRGTTSSLASTFDRAVATSSNASPLSTGRISVVRILLPKGLPVTSITFWSATTPLSSGNNQWFALFNSSRQQLAITGDDTSTAWAANTAKTLTVTSGPYVTTAAGWYYLGIMVKATTVPTILAITGSSAVDATAAPIPAGTADTGLTNPASCPSTLTTISTGTNPMIYAEVS